MILNVSFRQFAHTFLFFSVSPNVLFFSPFIYDFLPAIQFVSLYFCFNLKYHFVSQKSQERYNLHITNLRTTNSAKTTLWNHSGMLILFSKHIHWTPFETCSNTVRAIYSDNSNLLMVCVIFLWFFDNAFCFFPWIFLYSNLNWKYTAELSSKEKRSWTLKFVENFYALEVTWKNMV